MNDALTFRVCYDTSIVKNKKNQQLKMNEHVKDILRTNSETITEHAATITLS